MAALSAERPPVEITGEAGTVVFWHHRMAHAPSPNTAGRVRLAVLHDFVSRAADDRPPRPGELWRGWHGILNGVPTDLDDGPAPAAAAAARL